MSPSSDVQPTWSPMAASIDATAMSRFRASVCDRFGVEFAATPELHEWSITHPDAFWSSVWEFFGVVGRKGTIAYEPTPFPDARFFPEAELNIAENLLAPWRHSDAPAVMYVAEGVTSPSDVLTLTGKQLCSRVGAVANAFRERGVVPGDRVALVLPVNIDALVCTLAALAVGAVVSSVSPEFGAPAILDRLGQLEPRVLVVAPTTHWSGATYHRSENIADVIAGLPSLELVITTGDAVALEFTSALPAGCQVDTLDTLISGDDTLVFAQLPFDHPAYVLFTSGTTGKPKCLVHRAGGVLLKHLVELGLHADVRAGDRMLFYTTTSWMMWNWELSCLALGATLVLYDGAPTFPDMDALFRASALTGTTHLGVSARLLDHLRSSAVDVHDHVTSELRQVLVTGSPLSVTTAQWLAEQLGPRVMINPISGGTDLVGVFVGGDPTRPFVAGEMTGPMLGTAVDVFVDASTRAQDGEAGELVCLQPFPTVPLGIWGDVNGELFTATYFGTWPGIWVHGDRAVRSERGGVSILGRSDATLNVAGIRIGTAEIYAALANHPGVADCLAFGQEWNGDTRIVLLVVPPTGVALDEHHIESIRTTIRSSCSPRHVPAAIVEVAELPRTQTGKLAEIAVREAVHGREVKGLDALANPQVLDDIIRSMPRDDAEAN